MGKWTSLDNNLIIVGIISSSGQCLIEITAHHPPYFFFNKQLRKVQFIIIIIIYILSISATSQMRGVPHKYLQKLAHYPASLFRTLISDNSYQNLAKRRAAGVLTPLLPGPLSGIISLFPCLPPSVPSHLLSLVF